MCQKCTAPGPATGSLYLTISQTVLSAEREKGRDRVCAALCTHKCSSYSEGQRPHTHTTHNRTHRVLFDRLVLFHFAFICFNDLATNVRMAQAQSAATLGLFSVAHQPPRPLRPGQFLALLIAWQIANSSDGGGGSGGSGANCLPCRQVFAFVFVFHCLSLLFLHTSFPPPLPLSRVAVVVVLSDIDKWCTISAPSLTCQ